jgi:enolase
MKIQQILSREILDSRGQPTLECRVMLDNGIVATASVPSGASVGKYEACEVRDGDMTRFGGKGVRTPVHTIHSVIAPRLIGKEPDVVAMDNELCALDGTINKTHLGANTLLAVSSALIRAQAMAHNIELYDLINKLWKFEPPKLPLCMFNVINGGMHAQSGLCFQEFMIMPREGNFETRLAAAVKFYYTLKDSLAKKGYATAIGDEGGFAPAFTQDGIMRERAALDFLRECAGLQEEARMAFCLDVAASHFYDEQHKNYVLHDVPYSTDDLITLYAELGSAYPIVSLEDGCDQDDWQGWHHMTQQLRNKMQLVGDDVFVTNTGRIQEGADNSCATAVLIKPNQIGTVSETIAAIKLCKRLGYQTVISHRSGETNDSFIADLAVGTAAGQLKSGAPVRGERVAKYNRLWAIAQQLEG